MGGQVHLRYYVTVDKSTFEFHLGWTRRGPDGGRGGKLAARFSPLESNEESPRDLLHHELAEHLLGEVLAGYLIGATLDLRT